MRIIGIKIGSALITKLQKNEINDRFLVDLCRQVAFLQERGNKVFLVSSGAVACDAGGDRRRSRALHAAIGQGRLIGKYLEYLKIFGLDAAQILLVAFELKENRKHIKRLFEEAFKLNVIPIVNANDAVNSEELDRLDIFADNDELFTALCLELKADVAIFGTEAVGFTDRTGEIIHVIDERNFPQAVEMSEDTSHSKGFGQRGMLTKLQCGKRLTENNVRAIIAGGRNNDFAIKAVEELFNPTGNFGTVFRFTPLLEGV